MARIELVPEVLDDLDRSIEHMQALEIDNVDRRVQDLIHAIEVLAHSPLLGRPARENRELIIGRGARGYVALYRYVPAIDTVFVLAIRAQREAGYKGGKR